MLNYGAYDEPRHVAQEITRFVQLYGEELQSKMTEVPSDGNPRTRTAERPRPRPRPR